MPEWKWTRLQMRTQIWFRFDEDDYEVDDDVDCNQSSIQ